MRTPTDLANTSATIYIDDIYGNAIIDFVLYKAYLKDSEFAGNMQRSSTHYQLFANSIGQGSAAQSLLSPNQDKVNTFIPVQQGGM